MLVKKNADNRSLSGMFFSIGLMMALVITITAFEWKSFDNSNIVGAQDISQKLDELLDIPVTEQPPPPPPAKIQQPVVIEVPDEEEIEEEIEIELDMEIDEEEVIEEIMPVIEAEEEVTDEIFTIVEKYAEYPGGSANFYKYISKNLKYPEPARRLGVEGRVFVQFVVERDGSITDVKALKGIGGGCDEEAVRIVSKSPSWEPARQRGQPVRSRVIIPLIFTLGG